MNRKLYFELWQIRFQKLLGLEQKSIQDYRGLLAESKKNYPKHSIHPHLEEHIADEKKHELLVKELLEILKKQK